MRYYRQKLEIPQELLDKADLYSKLTVENLDKYGFISEDTGDSLLFTSLLHSSISNNLLKNCIINSEAKPGMFYRHPSLIPDKWIGQDASTTSKDMTIGLLWWIWTYKQKDVAEQIMSYLKNNYYKLGDYTPHTDPETIAKWVNSYPDYVPLKLRTWMAINEPLSRILYCPNLLASVMYKIGGKFSLWSLAPDINVTGLTDFEAHLQALGIALRGELRGYITLGEAEILKLQHRRQPENALFSALLALYVDPKAIAWVDITLGCKKYFPEDRLPTNKDRKCHWLWEKDYDTEEKEWEPDTTTPLQIYSGGDYLFIIRLLKG